MKNTVLKKKMGKIADEMAELTMEVEHLSGEIEYELFKKYGEKQRDNKALEKQIDKIDRVAKGMEKILVTMGYYAN